MENQAVEIFKRNRTLISNSWIQQQMAAPELREDLMSSAELEEQSNELLQAFVEQLSDTNIDSPRSSDFESVVNILRDISLSRTRQGFSPRETAFFVLSLKEALYAALQREVQDPSVLNLQSIKIERIIDRFSIETFETFVKVREETIVRQTSEIDEISTPVIQVWTGILALPIIGTLDSTRAQNLMENLLQGMVDTGSNIAILDISGVPAVDSLVAQHLIKTVSATRLMGGECIISGIRPEIAQTVVHLGIDLSHIITKASLAAALRTAFAMIGVKVQKIQ